MCWMTYDERKRKVMSAREDIPVFKVVNVAGFMAEPPDPETPASSGVPYYRGVNGLFREDMFTVVGADRGDGVYEAGRTYSASGFRAPRRNEPRLPYTAHKGFHSYSPECGLRLGNEGTALFVLRPASSPKGMPLDSFRLPYDCPSCGFWRVPGIMDCVIPKCSQYYVNENGEYVSNRLKVTGFRTVAEAARE